MSIKVIFLVPVFLCGFFTAFSQSPLIHTSFPVLDPAAKTPEAAAITKFGDIPVGLTTGVPNISIPIWNIKLKAAGVPISLNYNSSGIRVDEFATNVGLGWSLQAGGAITSTVFGLADLQAKGWLTAVTKTPQTGFMKEVWTSSPFFGTDDTFRMYMDHLSEDIDTQPDIFSASYPGGSIKFFFDQDAGIHLMPYKRVKIVRGVGGFEVTDEQDNKYYYGVTETALTTSASASGAFHNVSSKTTESFTDYLTKMVTPYGEEVRFHYEAVTPYTTYNNPSQTRYVDLYENTPCPSPTGRPADFQVTSSTLNYALRIKSIGSSTGDSISFTYGLSRDDLPGTYALTNITVRHGSTVITSFDLSHAFTNSSSYTAADKRLHLTAVEESGKSPYEFTYNSELLPARLSYAQDHWGYYNGMIFNSSLLPVDSVARFYTGGSREPDSIKCQAELLTQIKYPTGGTSTFNYEANRVYRTDVLYVPLPLRVTESASQYAVNSTSITIPSGAHDIKMEYITNTEELEGLEPFGEFKTIQIKSGSTLVRQISGTSLTPVPLDIAPGTYTLRLCTDPDLVGVYIKIYWRLENEADTVWSTGNKQCGGVRIKSIVDDPTGDAAAIKTTHYDYSQENNASRSSGSALSAPVYLSHVYQYQQLYGTDINCEFTSQSSSPVLSFGGTSGANVYYSHVNVYGDTKTGKGYTSHTFIIPGGDGVLEFPYPPVVTYDWVSGSETEIKDYQYMPGTSSYALVKKVNNSYTDTHQEPSGAHKSYVRGFKAANMVPATYTDPPANIHQVDPVFKVRTYDLVSSWFYLNKSIERVYVAGDTTQKVVTETSYFYGNPDHIELTRQEITRSDGEKYKVVLRYPLDVNPSFTYNSSPVVEKRILINNGSTDRLTSAELTTYKNQAGTFPLAYYLLNNTAPMAPSALPVYTGTVDLQFEKRADYTYDSDNNVASVARDGKYTGFHWGYNHQYMIAQCQNADDTEFYFQGLEGIAASGSTYAGDSHTGKQYTTGTSITWTPPNARAYVISYWKRVSGTWTYSGELTYSGTSHTLSGGDRYDDIRIYPADAQMTTYTYDPLVGISSVADAKGLTGYYEYDSYGRLKLIKDQNGNIVKAYEYNYKP